MVIILGSINFQIGNGMSRTVKCSGKCHLRDGVFPALALLIHDIRTDHRPVFIIRQVNVSRQYIACIQFIIDGKQLLWRLYLPWIFCGAASPGESNLFLRPG